MSYSEVGSHGLCPHVGGLSRVMAALSRLPLVQTHSAYQQDREDKEHHTVHSFWCGLWWYAY